MLEVVRTTRRAAIVLVWLALTGGAVAQGAFADSTEVIEHGAALVAAIQGALEGDAAVDGAADLVAGITNALYTQVTQDESGEIPDEFPICTYLVGTAGTVPRLDGGGERLAAFGSEFSAIDRIERSAYPIASFEDGAQLVIVDAFLLGDLAGRVNAWIRSNGALVIDASPPNDDLWSALVGFLVERPSGEDPSQASVPHGHVVAFHALSLLPPGAEIRAFWSEDVDYYIGLEIEHRPDDGSVDRLTVHLIDIDFGGIETIKRAMHVISGLGPAAVVMSWGLVDCFVRDAYAGTTEPATLAEYVHESLSGREDVESLVRELCSAVEAVRNVLDIQESACDGPFEPIALLGPLAYFADLNERTNEAVEGVAVGHSYFAAAGNQGLSFSMPPAAWAGIHAVEACALNDGRFAGLPWFSNRGTTAEGDDAEPVSSLGAWFKTVETREGRQGGEPEVLGYWGTSFAAPAAAVNFLGIGFQSAYPPCE